VHIKAGEVRLKVPKLRGSAVSREPRPQSADQARVSYVYDAQANWAERSAFL
jgi:hypothetical protein